jgi:hypothetical protein
VHVAIGRVGAEFWGYGVFLPRHRPCIFLLGAGFGQGWIGINTFFFFPFPTLNIRENPYPKTQSSKIGFPIKVGIGSSSYRFRLHCHAYRWTLHGSMKMHHLTSLPAKTCNVQKVTTMLRRWKVNTMVWGEMWVNVLFVLRFWNEKINLW